MAEISVFIFLTTLPFLGVFFVQQTSVKQAQRFKRPSQKGIRHMKLSRKNQGPRFVQKIEDVSG